MSVCGPNGSGGVKFCTFEVNRIPNIKHTCAAHTYLDSDLYSGKIEESKPNYYNTISLLRLIVDNISLA